MNNRKLILVVICCVSFTMFSGFSYSEEFSPFDDKLVNTSVTNGSTAYIPTYKITVNGQVIDNKRNQYPFLVYGGVTYLPLTYDLNRFMGVRLYIYNTVRERITQRYYVGRTKSESTSFKYPERSCNNPKKVSIQPLKCPLQLNNLGYENDDANMSISPSPFMFRDIIYVPLTRNIMREEFGWKFEWTKEKGLIIDTRDPMRPILFNPSGIDAQAPWRYMENNPYDFVCKDAIYVGIKNKASSMENNDILVKEAGRIERHIAINNYLAVWVHHGASDLAQELREKGIHYPQLDGRELSFLGVKSDSKQSREINRDNIYVVTVNIDSGEIVKTNKI